VKNVLLGILCWNHLEIAQRCLLSVREHTNLTDVELVIIDNGSDDPATIEWFDYIDETVWRNDKNYGIVGGMRKTFERIFAGNELPEFTCLLNCDTLVTDGWLSRLVDIHNVDDTFLAVAPKDNNCYTQYQYFAIPEGERPEKFGIGLFGDDTKMQDYVQREFYAKRKHPAHTCVEAVDPPAALWRTATVRECGGFSKQFDYGYGVLELFIRGHLKDYKVVYCLSSFIYHYAHGGAGKYEGYKKKFGISLNEGVVKMAKDINDMYDVNIATYGNAHAPMEPSTLERERELIQL